MIFSCSLGQSASIIAKKDFSDFPPTFDNIWILGRKYHALHGKYLFVLVFCWKIIMYTYQFEKLCILMSVFKRCSLMAPTTSFLNIRALKHKCSNSIDAVIRRNTSPYMCGSSLLQ